jgi:hypothetical protein
MPYASNRDRAVPELERVKVPFPAPPLNVFMESGFMPGVFNIRWDDPAQLALNSPFLLCGVNVYRSFDSEFGPYERITQLPIGSNFWRDRTDTEQRVSEDVSASFIMLGPSASASGADFPRYAFKTQFPIIKSGSQGIFANRAEDVQVLIDGVPAVVKSVFGRTGEIELESQPRADVARQTIQQQVLPKPGSVVTCSYVRMRSLVRTDLATRVFYRVTTVGLPEGCDLSSVSSSDLVETPLEDATGTSNAEIEKLDYMWREAIRRNRWILEQGGERVKLFLQKTVGIPCPCIQDDYHKQPINDDPLCFGTGIVGGYEGPYDILIAPDDAERRIAQKDIGRTVEHAYEVWTGPVPLLSMRDFIVKLNGDRYSIGAVRMPSNRGMVLQQHFNIGHFDEKDIRYRVGVHNPVKFAAVEFKPSGPEQEAEAHVTDKPNIPEDRQLRGRTPAWENITYGILLLILPWHEILHALGQLSGPV